MNETKIRGIHVGFTTADNAEFSATVGQVAKMLRQLAKRLEEGQEPTRLMDVNGNSVAEVTITH